MTLFTVLGIFIETETIKTMHNATGVLHFIPQLETCILSGREIRKAFSTDKITSVHDDIRKLLVVINTKLLHKNKLWFLRTSFAGGKTSNNSTPGIVKIKVSAIARKRKYVDTGSRRQRFPKVQTINEMTLPMVPNTMITHWNTNTPVLELSNSSISPLPLSNV